MHRDRPRPRPQYTARGPTGRLEEPQVGMRRFATDRTLGPPGVQAVVNSRVRLTLSIVGAGTGRQPRGFPKRGEDVKAEAGAYLNVVQIEWGTPIAQSAPAGDDCGALSQPAHATRRRTTYIQGR
jgi:hypothetical protein